MTSIVLIGASGNIGSRILDEALARKHSVTALTRDPRKLAPRPGMT
ncbi:MAG: NAD(P)H-binding protein, partial [Reyranella sp.]